MTFHVQVLFGAPVFNGDESGLAQKRLKF